MAFTGSRTATPSSVATVALFAFAIIQACASAPASAEPNARAVQVTSGTFTDPVYVTVAPGMIRYLFVVERPGVVQILRDEVKLPQPFLDIRNIVRGLPDSGAGSEQGLLSIAFPPDYETSGRFYAYFTNNSGSIEINEFRRSTGNNERADPATRRRLLIIPHPTAQNHNGGQLQFGPDGHLYAATGDGGTGGSNARNLNNLLGKILRISPRPSGGREYGIPADNPFTGARRRREIFAYGLRHPWRFSFDGQRIAIGDVGQSQREEVNLLNVTDASGVNFGWPQYEGNLVFDNTRPGPTPPIFPMFEYSHNGGRCAIIGGFVVHDANLPAFKQRYVYGDACTGQVRSFLPNVGAQTATDDGPTGINLPGLSSFGRGFGHQIYMTDLGTNRVWRLEPQAP